MIGSAKSSIDGRLISIKDNICTRDLPTTCASRILDKFTSPFNATVVEQLEKAGGVIAGKTNLDEFGMGSHSVHSRFGPVKNPRRDHSGEELSAGGSSGGSAVAVAADQCYAWVVQIFKEFESYSLTLLQFTWNRYRWFCQVTRCVYRDGGIQAIIRAYIAMGSRGICQFTRHSWNIRQEYFQRARYLL